MKSNVVDIRVKILQIQIMTEIHSIHGKQAFSEIETKKMQLTTLNLVGLTCLKYYVGISDL